MRPEITGLRMYSNRMAGRLSDVAGRKWSGEGMLAEVGHSHVVPCAACYAERAYYNSTTYDQRSRR
jgi:hypothetical protein